MGNIRCKCHKIICQVEESEVIIRCRHCKRYLVIKMSGPPLAIEEKLPGPGAMEAALARVAVASH